MPDKEELEIMLDDLEERNLVEFPDDDAWNALKAEIMGQVSDDGEDS